MILAQVGPEMAQNVSLPLWAVGVFVTCLMASLGLVGMLIATRDKEFRNTFQKTVELLVKSMDDLSRSLSDYKDKSEKKFVSNSTFNEYKHGVEKEITGIQAALKDVAIEVDQKIRIHKEDCPARVEI